MRPFQASFLLAIGIRRRIRWESHDSPSSRPTWANEHPFAAKAAVPDGLGNILLGWFPRFGTRNSLPLAGTNGASFTVGNVIVANRDRAARRAGGSARFGAELTRAESLPQLAPGEPIVALGSGFGNGAQIPRRWIGSDFPFPFRRRSIVATLPRYGH